MSDSLKPEEGFAERVKREAGEEATAVVADLAKVRFRADQVARVLRALNLPLPDEVGMLLGMVTYRTPEPAELPSPVAPVSAKPETPREEPPPAVVPGVRAEEPQASSTASPGPPKTEVKIKKSSGGVGHRRRFLAAPAPEDLRTEAAVKADLVSLGEVSSQTLQDHWQWSNRATVERVLRHFYDNGLLKVASAGGGAVATTYRVGGENVFDSWPTSSVGWKSSPASQGERFSLALELTARQQDAIVAVLEVTREHLVPSEVREELQNRGLDLPLARVGDYLRILADAETPAVIRTGITRRGDKQSQGRTAIEYRALSVTDGKAREAARAELSGFAARMKDKAELEDAPGPQRQRPFPGDEKDEGDGPPAVEGPVEEDLVALTLKRVRDHVTANPQHVHTYETVAKLCDLTEEQATEALARLTLQGVLKPRPTGGYSYVKPTDPGAAARIDARRPSGQASSGGHGPVSGTGKKKVVSHPEVRKILTVVDRQLGSDSYRMTPSGHWEISAPKGRVLIAGTPSSNRTLLNDRARLRRAGIKGLGS